MWKRATAQRRWLGRRRGPGGRPSVRLPWRRALALALLGALVLLLGRATDRYLRLRATRAAIARTRDAVERFRIDIGRCPRSPIELVHPPRPLSLQLRELPRDGWGRALWIACPGRLDPEDIDVVSAGPSGDFLLDDNVY